MASIDWGMIGLGALIGVGCKKQLRAASRIAATTAASLAGATAAAVAQIAEETEKSSQSPEERAAAERLAKIDQQISQQAGQGKNG